MKSTAYYALRSLVRFTFWTAVVFGLMYLAETIGKAL